MEIQEAAAPLPVPRLRAPAPADMAPSEETFQTYWADGNDNHKGLGEFAGRLGFPLPPKAPRVEGTVYSWKKTRDGTGSEHGDMKKRQAFDSFNDVGDTRRLILHVLSPSTKGRKAKKGKKPKKEEEKKGLKGLATQLKARDDKSLVKIAEFVAATGLDMRQPDHFRKFPQLSK